MPFIQVKVDDPKVTCSTENGKSKWWIGGGGSLIKSHSQFDIYNNDHIYDGFSIPVSVTIELKNEENTNRLSEILGGNADNAPGKINIAFWDEMEPDLEVTSILDEVDFFRVAGLIKGNSITVSIFTESATPGFSMGENPNGMDIVWRTNEQIYFSPISTIRITL